MQNFENSRFRSQEASKLRFNKYLYHRFVSILKKNLRKGICSISRGPNTVIVGLNGNSHANFSSIQLSSFYNFSIGEFRAAKPGWRI